MPIAPPRLLPAIAAAALLVASAAAQPQAAPDVERAYRAGTGLLNRGMNDLAADEYRAFLQANPDHAKAPLARYGLAVCLVRLAKYDAAAAELDRVVDIVGFEFAADAKLLRARCCLASQDAATAAEWLTTLLKDHPKFAGADTAASLLGEVQYGQGDVDQARRTLASMIEQHPKSESRERAEYILALCDAASGHDQSAADRLATWRATFSQSPLLPHATLVEAQCRHRLADAPKALLLYEAAAKSADASIIPLALLGKAQLVRASGDAAQAASILDELSARDPSFAATPPFLLERARCLADAGNHTQALDLLTRTQIPPADPLGAERGFWMGRCELKLGRPDKAAAILTETLAAYPQSPLAADLSLERASALTAAGKDAQAAEVYRALAQSPSAPADPRSARATLALAGALHRLAQYEESLIACRDFLRTNPTDPGAADARLLIAENLYQQRNYAAAEKAYAQFLSLDPDHTQAWRATARRGLCLTQLSDPQQALPLLRQAAQATPSDPALAAAVATALGDLAFAAADWPEAEKWFRLGTAPTTPPAPAETSAASLLKLGLCLHRQGKLQDAIAVYEQLNTLAPDSDAALQATFENGQAQVELGRPDDAAASFQRTLSLEANAKEPRFRAYALRHLAAIASQQGRDEQAASFLAQLATLPGAQAADAVLDRAVLLLGAGELDQAESAFSDFLTQYPSHARAEEARARRAIAVCRIGRIEEALAELDALSQRPPLADPALAAAIAYERAWALTHLKRTSEAATAYQSLLATKPPADIESHAALELAQIRMAEGDYSAALTLLARCRSIASATTGTQNSALLPRATYLQGVCELRTERNADAVKTLSTFATDFPDSDLLDSAAVTLGEAFLASGRAADAAREFRAVAERTKDQPLRSASLLRLGEAAAAAQDWAASRSAFARHRELFADSDQWFRAQFGIGWALENAGKREDAIAAYRPVVDSHDGPTAARAQFQIGECLYGLGRHDDAVRELIKVDILYQYPEWSAAALYEAGRCLAEQNKQSEAIAQFDQVTKRFPDSQWARPAAEAAAAAKPASLPGRTSSSTPAATSSVQPGRQK